MAHIVAVTNQKGGVGKTTTSINVCASLAQAGKRVLLVDMDPQANATVGIGIDPNSAQYNLYDILLENAEASDCLVKSDYQVELLTAHGDLAGAQVELLNEIGREMRLKHALAAISDNYDFVYIDCPPALNVLTINALVAADAVLIPMQCEYFALEGLSALVSTIRKIKQALNSRLRIEGLLRTMYDGRNSLSKEVSRQLRSHFGDKVYTTIIPRNIRLAEAPSHGEPAIVYDELSKGAVAYKSLVEEILQRDLSRRASLEQAG